MQPTPRSDRRGHPSPGPRSIPRNSGTPRFSNVFRAGTRIAASGLARVALRGAGEAVATMAALLAFGFLWAGVASLEGVERGRRGEERAGVTTFAVASPDARLSSIGHERAQPDQLDFVDLSPTTAARTNPWHARRGGESH